MPGYVPCSFNGAPAWTQTTSLEGRDYQLAFDWHQRMGRWVLHLRDQDGVNIRTGMVLNEGVEMLRGVVGTARPPGEFVVVDTSGAGDADPGFADLGIGARFVLVYFTAADLA